MGRAAIAVAILLVLALPAGASADGLVRAGAAVTFGDGRMERLEVAPDGSFRTTGTLGDGQSAEVVIEDEWGNTVREPAAIEG